MRKSVIFSLLAAFLFTMALGATDVFVGLIFVFGALASLHFGGVVNVVDEIRKAE